MAITSGCNALLSSSFQVTEMALLGPMNLWRAIVVCVSENCIAMKFGATPNEVDGINQVVFKTFYGFFEVFCITTSIAVLAVIGVITFLKYSAHSRQQGKASEHDPGPRNFDEAESESEPQPELEPESQLDGDPKLQPKHKIFLSHSGAQKDFVEQLCVDLESFHHFPFFDKRDDSLPKGLRFPELIFQAAKECRVAVVVLSEEFFTRTKWPMLELDAFAKAQKLHDGYPRILPLFFKLTRAQCHESVRRKRWLKVWQGWAQDDSRIVIEDWVNALNVFGPTNGIVYKSDGEVSYRKAALTAIINLVPPNLQYDTTSLEGSERLCEVIVNKFHQVKASMNYGVRVVGVYGVGGLGKTTVCKALCNTQSAKYDGRVCLAELGGLSREELQKQVLRELTQLNPELEKELQGDKVVRLLKERIHKHKVFLAIDNVWDTSVSRDAALTFLQAGFHGDSMVLVTARTKDILVRLDIDKNHCIEMPELDKEEATKLFLHHALPHCSQLESAQRDVVEQCVERCRFDKGGGVGTCALQYLPLAIKVLAGQLGDSSKDPLDWREGMSKLNFNRSQERVHPIFSILRTSYDSLTKAQQLLFMDVALFCPHPYSRIAEENLYLHEGITSGNVFYWLSLLHNKSLRDTKDDLQILKRRSLLEHLGDGLSRITLHDLYYEFAINESQAMDFSERRWLFADYKTCLKMTGIVSSSTTDVPEDLQCNPGLSCWPALKRIAICNSKLRSLGRSELQYCSNVVLLKFVNCLDVKRVELHDLGYLKFLEVDGCLKLEASSLGIEGMRNLVWLRWSRSSLSYPCFPDLSLLKSLRVLELVTTTNYWRNSTQSLLSSLPGLEDCVNLVELKLVGHKELLAFPDLSRMVSLQKVLLRGCGKASGLRGLSSKMTQLQELLTLFCRGIVELPGVEELVTLKKLQLDGSGIKGSLPDLKKLTNLEFLSCEFLHYLTEVPDLRTLSEIKHISFSLCTRLSSVLKANIDCLTTLQYLDVCGTSISILPDLSNLKDLRVCYFFGIPLTALPKDFARLATIPEVSMNSCKFLRIPLLEFLGERVPEVQELVAMEALDSIYEDFNFDQAEEGPHPSASFVSRLLECIQCSGDQLHLRRLAVSLLSMMSLQFQPTANRSFNTKVLDILGQVEGGVESVIRVFCEEEDVGSLFYVIAGFVFIGHRCSALRASNTLHQISRRVIQFEEGNRLSKDVEFCVSVLHCLEIMFEDPVIASAFGDQVAIDFLEKLKLLDVHDDRRGMRSVTFDRIRTFYKLGFISEKTGIEFRPSAHEMQQLYLAKIDALLEKARRAFVSHGHCSEIGDTGCAKDLRALETTQA